MNEPESTVSPEIRRGIARMVSELMTGPVYFPQLELDQVSGEVYRQHTGATMLDHFAGQAMLGLLNRMTELDGDEPDVEKASDALVAISGLSYQMGLNMVEARRRALAGEIPAPSSQSDDARTDALVTALKGFIVAIEHGIVPDAGQIAFARGALASVQR